MQSLLTLIQFLFSVFVVLPDEVLEGDFSISLHTLVLPLFN